jgi:hypothetical protein
MRNKNKYYKVEQHEIIDKIMNILDLNDNMITLHELDNDKEKHLK